MKQTAVEWLEKKFYFTNGQLIDIDFEQAKSMEKEQIIEAYQKGFIRELGNRDEDAEQYYKETFKSE